MCVKRVAELLDVHERTVQRMLATGELAGFRTYKGRGRWRIPEANLQAYIAREIERQSGIRERVAA